MPDQLDTTSLLQLYLAEELSASQRTGVEQMLASDAAVRQELERLRELSAAAEELIAGADRERPLPMSAEAAVRRFARDANQWNVDRLTRRRPEPVVRKNWNLRAVSAVAAVLVLSLTLYIWHRIAQNDDQFASSQPAGDVENVSPSDGVADNGNNNNNAPGGAGMVATPASSPSDDTALAQADVTNPALLEAPAPDEGQQQVRSAEREMEAIAVLTDAGNDDWMASDTGGGAGGGRMKDEQPRRQ